MIDCTDGNEMHVKSFSAVGFSIDSHNLISASHNVDCSLIPSLRSWFLKSIFVRSIFSPNYAYEMIISHNGISTIDDIVILQTKSQQNDFISYVDIKQLINYNFVPMAGLSTIFIFSQTKY